MADQDPTTARESMPQGDGAAPRSPAPLTPPAAPAPALAAAERPVTPRPVAPAGGHPSRWGRVDDDGTVYLHTDQGERAVGSWQAGEPADGLAHFARRFDDLLTEAELLAARLASGSGNPRQTAASARALREGLAEASVVGDVAGLAALLDALIERAEAAQTEARQARSSARAEAVARKERLVAEAERLAAEASHWKQAGDRFKAILEEWKTVRGVDRKIDEQLWKRFSRARDAFNRRRGSHFAELDRQRVAARNRKEELVHEAERLVQAAEWGPTAARYKQLMADWKSVGRASKEVDEALWHRFRTAQDAFFARRPALLDERDVGLAEAARRKEELLAEAERIDTSDIEAARAALRGIQQRWEDVGKVPRERIRELEGRMRAAEERVRSAADRRWRRSDPEGEARVAQFRERLEHLQAQAAKARAAGDDRRAQQAEAQAAQWRQWLTTAEQVVQER